MAVTATGVTVAADLLAVAVRLLPAAALATILRERTTVVTETAIATMTVIAAIPVTALVPRTLGTNPRPAHLKFQASRSLHLHVVTATAMIVTTVTAVTTVLTAMIVKVSTVSCICI